MRVNLPNRSTRGKRQSNVEEDELEADASFWQQDFFADEHFDDDYVSEAEQEDVFDSDFNDTEDDNDDDGDDGEEKQKRKTLRPPGYVAPKAKPKSITSSSGDSLSRKADRMALVSAAAAATAAAAAQYRRKASERRDGSGHEAEAEDEDDEDDDEREEAEDNVEEEEEDEEDDAMTVVRHLDNEEEEEDEERDKEGDEERDVDGGGEDDDGGDGDGDGDDESDEEESEEVEGDEDEQHGTPRKKRRVLHPRLRGKGKTTESKSSTTPSSSTALAMAGAHHKGASPSDGRMKRRGVQMGASESEAKSPGLTTNRSRKQLVAAAAAAAAIAAADTPRLRRSTVFRSEESQKVREKLQQQQKKRSWNAPSASWRPLSQEELLIEAARTEMENAISLQHLLALEEETKRQASIGKKLYDGPKIRIRSFRVGGGTDEGGGEKVSGTNGEEVEELTTLEVVNMPYLPDWLVPKESSLTAAAIASSNGNLLDPKGPNPYGAFLTNSASRRPENKAVPPEIVRRRQLRGAPLVKAGQANGTTSLKTEEVPEPEKKGKPGWSPQGLPETRSVVSVKTPSDSGSECGFHSSLQQDPMSYGMMALVVNLYESLKGSLPPQRPTCAGDLLTSHNVNNAPCFHRASSQAKLD